MVAVAGLFVGLCASGAQADTLTVTLDHATLVKYPPDTEAIIIGNPQIADVTMLKAAGLAIFTGKGFGETNVVFLTREGTILSESNVAVRASSAMLTVQRGGDRESYFCAPRCQPTVSLGDGSTFLRNAMSDVAARNGFIAPSPASGGATAGH